MYDTFEDVNAKQIRTLRNLQIILEEQIANNQQRIGVLEKNILLQLEKQIAVNKQLIAAVTRSLSSGLKAADISEIELISDIELEIDLWSSEDESYITASSR